MQLVKVRWGKRWSEREDLKLEDPTLESKSQETPMPWPYRNLKIGIFQIDGHEPIPCLDGLPNPRNRQEPAS